jgi:aminoglycoside phosphotransferase family enzyme
MNTNAEAFHARVAAERVVDAHGDLRPEHVFLTPEPQIIDCLEFSAELRLLDSAAETAFLALECERLGHAALAARLIELYRQYGRDDVDADLLGFYRSSQAFVRAKLAAWHLHDELPPATADHWRERTRWYLGVAASRLARGHANTHSRTRTR